MRGDSCARGTIYTASTRLSAAKVLFDEEWSDRQLNWWKSRFGMLLWLSWGALDTWAGAILQQMANKCYTKLHRVSRNQGILGLSTAWFNSLWNAENPRGGQGGPVSLLSRPCGIVDQVFYWTKWSSGWNSLAGQVQVYQYTKCQVE